MIISYHGGECFKISQGDLSLVLNPQSKMSADITLRPIRPIRPIRHTQGRPEELEGRQAQGKPEVSEKAGFVIEGPGEYEVKEVFVKGFMDKSFLITFEGIKLCFISTEINQEHEELEDIDILFLPVNAYKSAVALEPRVMIPMNYDKSSLIQFLKEAGEKDVSPLDKFVVKKKDLEGKEGEIVVLKEE